MMGLIIVVVYFVVMIAIGLWSRSKARGATNFFVAGRSGSSLFITGSLLATIIGGSATVGMAGLGFSQGLTGMWWLLVGTVGLIVLGIFLAGKVRQFGLYTLPELVEKQYDKRIGLAASILIVISWVGVIAAQIVASGKILSVLGMGDPTMWMIIFSGVFIAYTVIGGQYSVIRTDIVQVGIIFLGIFGGLALVLTRVGGWGGLETALPADHFAFPISESFGGYELVSLLLLVGLTYVVGPDMYSRLFCAKDGRTARKSVFWAAALIIPFALGITVIGMGASAMFPGISPEQAFPTVITEVLPPFLGYIVLAALLGAVMSSADTCLMTASTILSVDIVGRFKPSLSQDRLLFLSRWGIVLLGICSLLVALALKGVISSLLFAYTVYTCGVILPVLAGFYKDKLKVTSLGALAAIIGGGGLALVSKLFEIKYLDLGGLLASGVLLFAVSFIENRVRGKSLDRSRGI
ncbi:MAG TPA: sodium:solute symporter family protein [Dehalococcoidales bacterium]|nr:sodium:solute symporter family protein [Dehalococcoidales bacterium]